MRVLLIEDDRDLAEILGIALTQRGLAIDVAPTIGDAEAYLASIDYAAILLDLGLPDGDGLALLDAIRGRGDSRPVIVLTARGTVDARIRGLNAGADDYLVKPFDVDELHARLLAILRRQGGYLGRHLVCGRLQFAVETRVALVATRPLTLSVRETELLELLLRRAGHVVPKRIVEDHLFGLDGDLASNAVEVYVHRLRKKLEDGDSGARIETVRGIGYMIVPLP